MTTEELLRELRVPLAPEGHHHTRAGWRNSDCPYCSPQSHRFRLGWNLRGGYAHCWMCKGVPLVPTLARLTGREPREIASLTRILEKDRFQPAGGEKTGISHAGTLKPPPDRGKLRKAHRKFLEERGFDPDEVAHTWGLEGIGPLGGRWAGRLYIPMSLGKSVVSWTTRSCVDSDPRRYDTAPADRESYPSKRLLYGEEAAGHAVVVVEGPLDVWAGGPGFVGTLGTAYSRAQLLRLVRFPVRYVCFDAEEDAQRVARKLVRELSAFDGVTKNVVLETGKDASRCKPWELKQLQRLVA